MLLLCLAAQQFEHWACPAVLKVNEINVVTDAGNLMRARVNIISYDMIPRMVDRIRERHFQVVIAV